jgi:hypothetical protein
MTLSITTFSITTLRIITLSDYAECHCAESRYLFIVMLNVLMVSVVMLSVIFMLNVVMLSFVVMLSVIFMLNVIMLSVVMLNVSASSTMKVTGSCHPLCLPCYLGHRDNKQKQSYYLSSCPRSQGKYSSCSVTGALTIKFSLNILCMLCLLFHIQIAGNPY